MGDDTENLTCVGGPAAGRMVNARPTDMQFVYVLSENPRKYAHYERRVINVGDPITLIVPSENTDSMVMKDLFTSYRDKVLS